MNRQEVYDKVVTHARGVGPDGRCLYRLSDGKVGCPIGALIPDSLYVPDMEGFSANLLLERYPALSDYLEADADDTVFLRDLQLCHDTYQDIRLVREQLTNVGRLYGLVA